MIGLDTNVLVRYLVQDDAKQGALASDLIERHCSRDEPGFVNVVVLCELVWVLSRAYRFPADDVAATIEKLLQAAELEFEDAEMAWAALRRYRAAKTGFVDAIIGLRNRRNGCATTATFDRDAAGLEEFTAAAALGARAPRR